MSVAQSIYLFAVAGVNVAMGWLFYATFESLLGLGLVAVGLLVVCSVIGRALSERAFLGNAV